MAKTITVAGKDLKLAYTLLTAVSYEKMTGKSAFELSQFQNNQIAPVVELGYCMLVSSNPEGSVPPFETVLGEFNTARKMTAFLQSVSEELITFYRKDKGDATEDAEGSGDAEKNS